MAGLIRAEPWVHPSLEVRPSQIEGRGLFATEDLERGTVVMRLGGRTATDEELSQIINDSDGYVDTVTLGDGENLVLPPGTTAHYGNHSCEPNLEHLDAITIVTARPIQAGEEVTVDYEVQSGELSGALTCTCGVPTCRGVVRAHA